jgi:hypothetical protein
MYSDFPVVVDACVLVQAAVRIPSMKNDEKDRHVVAAAVKCGCEVIVTYNLKHFNVEHLKPFDVCARGSRRIPH